MDPDPSDSKPTPTVLTERPPYASVDPETDMRRMFAGTFWYNATGGGYPIRTTLGEWMVRTVLDLPYGMLAALEAVAQSEQIGDLIRAALAAAGYGSEADVMGVPSDRYVTSGERAEELGLLVHPLTPAKAP